MAMSVRYEAKLWLFAILKCIPGRIGCAVRRIALPARIGPGARIWEGVHIDRPGRLMVGARTSINRGCTLNAGGGIEIAEDVLIGPNVTIYSQNHLTGAGTTIASQGYEYAPVRIERDAWLAANVTVLPGVTVGEGAVVGAGAVVVRDVPAMAIAVGVPATVVGERD